MATLTSTAMAAQPKAVHVGINNVSGSYMIAASSSVGDRVLLANIPQGAAITDFWAAVNNGATGTGFDIGLDFGVVNGGAGSLSCLAGAASTGAVIRYNIPTSLPPVISVSDAHPVRYGTAVLKIASGTMTTSSIIVYSINYKMDNV